ncbi:unnamed protein product [Chondrus crispus]|uniref:Uncharacterized protein n=1 Tax=Chondrus crispus TaxID=2769 RepID=R7QKG2_CHOCR|nr:unnamed protein product [Chondrus crispus]CDF37895.1 unnamed protein product [Chondrus crispus]|eukprot:XP_005717766.1 unnamed protein product [Chondrus crispus]
MWRPQACFMFYLRAIVQKIDSHSAFIAYVRPLIIHVL